LFTDKHAVTLGELGVEGDVFHSMIEPRSLEKHKAAVPDTTTKILKNYKIAYKVKGPICSLLFYLKKQGTLLRKVASKSGK